MIRHGREVVDQRGIAALHGLPWHTARRLKPWSHQAHPAPVNLLPGERARRGRPTLWDRAQATSFALGEPVPPIPEIAHPDDLLDAVEVADLRGVSLRQLTEARAYLGSEVPPPDACPCGVEHWRRAVAATMNLRVAAPDRHRPSRAESADRRKRLEATLAAMTAAGEVDVDGLPLNTSEFARRSRVTRVTAQRFLSGRQSDR